MPAKKEVEVDDLSGADQPIVVKGAKPVVIKDREDKEEDVKEAKPFLLKHKKEGEKHAILTTGKIPERREEVKKETRVKESSDRVPTGIKGLDEVMGGGLEQGSVNIIGGGPGSGKSIFCMQFLVNGALKFNEPGIYITFEENKKKLIKHMKSFGWDLEKLEKEDKLTIVEYTPQQVKKLLSEGGGIIDNVIEKNKVKRMVIDSLTAFTLLHKDALEKIEASLALFNMVSEWGCTALLTAESEPDPSQHKAMIMEFEVDGVILLYNVRKEDTRERSLEILKLRGIHHASKIFPMKVTDQGIEIYPKEVVF